MTSRSNSNRPDRNWEDDALIEACREGDQAAWDALVDKYSRLVYSIPARYQLPPEEAADVFQGVWLDLYRDLHGLQNSGALRSWLLTATSRRCLLHKRKVQRTITSDSAEGGAVPDPGPDPLAIQQGVERRHLLDLAISRLPDRCARLVRILFFEQPPVPYAEAARRLGLAEGSIGFIRGRCLEKLRKNLQDLGIS